MQVVGITVVPAATEHAKLAACFAFNRGGPELRFDSAWID